MKSAAFSDHGKYDFHSYRRITKPFGWLLVLAFALLGLVACSGGGDGDDNKTNPTPPPSKPSITITGAATKGPINGATVQAYALDSDGNIGSTALDTTTTISDGSFSLDIGSYTGNVIVEVTGGSYIDEASNGPVNNAATLRVVLTNVTGNVKAQATPLTEIAAQIAAGRNAGLTTANVQSATALVSNLIGGADIVSTEPANVLDASAATASTEAQLYGLMLATISQMAQDPSAVATTLAAMAADLSDNTLDSTGSDLKNALAAFDNSGYNLVPQQTVNQADTLITAYTADAIPDLGFSMDDLAGTWNSVGFATPAKGSLSNGYFTNASYSVLQNTGAYTNVCLFDSNSPCFATESGTGASITNNGFMPSLNLDPEDREYSVMSANKNLVVSLYIAPGDLQRLAIALKKANSYSWSDLQGSWMHMSINSSYSDLSNTSILGHGFGIHTIDFTDNGSGWITCIASDTGCGNAPVPLDPPAGLIGDDGWFSPSGLNPGETDLVAISADKNFMAEASKRLDGLFTSIIVRKADSYSLKELTGTWVRLALSTPLGMSTDPGKYGFDVGTLILNDNGSFAYSCIDTSSTGGCATVPVGGAMTSFGDCNITDPPYPPGETECGMVSADKDVIVTMIVNSDTQEQELSILLKRSDTTADVGTTYNFAEYFLPDTQLGCFATYQYTDGTNLNQQFTNTITDSYNVDYTSVSIPALEIENRDADDNLLNTFIVSQDASTVRYLGYNGYYIAKDCNMSAPDPRWAFSTVYDGMIVDQTGIQSQVNTANSNDCVTEFSNQKLLFKVQEITVQNTTYPNAVIMYYLDTKYPYQSPTMPQPVIDTGITWPTVLDTGGESITAFDIYAANSGEIMGSNVAAESGIVFDPYELISSSCPAPVN